MLVYKLTKYITVDKAVIKRLSIISSQQKQKKKKIYFCLYIMAAGFMLK